jgi:hypothetical protein
MRENNGKISEPLLFGARAYHPGSFLFLQIRNPRKLLDGDLGTILTIVALRRAASGNQIARYEKVYQNEFMAWKARHPVLPI